MDIFIVVGHFFRLYCPKLFVCRLQLSIFKHIFTLSSFTIIWSTKHRLSFTAEASNGTRNLMRMGVHNQTKMRLRTFRSPGCKRSVEHCCESRTYIRTFKLRMEVCDDVTVAEVERWGCKSRTCSVFHNLQVVLRFSVGVPQEKVPNAIPSDPVGNPLVSQTGQEAQEDTGQGEKVINLLVFSLPLDGFSSTCLYSRSGRVSRIRSWDT